MAFNRMGAGAMPTPERFQRSNGPGVGGSYTDWDSYNSAVMRYRQNQEESRFGKAQKLLSDVVAMYQDNGALDQSFRNAKNRFMAKSAANMAARGMGNVVNMPAIDLAYEKEVRPEFEIAKQSRLAQAMQAMAGLYSSYAPSYEQFAQPMSVARVGGESGYGNGGAFPRFAAMPTSGYPAEMPGVKRSLPSNPIDQRLDRVGGSGSSDSLFASIRAAEVMQGADPDWRAANDPRFAGSLNRIAGFRSRLMTDDDPYLQFGPRISS